MIDYRANPFRLNDEDITWVERTLAGMTREEKIGQIFCITGMVTDTQELTELVRRHNPGSFMYRAGDGTEIQEAYQAMDAASKVPMLFPCNLESGGNGISPAHRRLYQALPRRRGGRTGPAPDAHRQFPVWGTLSRTRSD